MTSGANAKGPDAAHGIHGLDDFPAKHGTLRVLDIVGLVGIAVLGVILRFFTRSALWLDEALTVHLAGLPLDQLPEALRHDGHPPLYYVLLHGWMNIFGTSDLAVRSLSGLLGLVFVALMWVAGDRLGGRRVAWCAVLLVSVLPFALRYSTEARMYSLVMVLVIAGWLLVDRALRQPRFRDLALLCLCTSALLWTHYWALWLGLTAAVGIGVRWYRLRNVGDREGARAAAMVLAALAVGAATFLPWLGILRYQSAHTGTPWGARTLPPTVIVESLNGLGGGGHGDQVIAGWVVGICVLLGLFATWRPPGSLEIELRTVPDARRAAIAAVGTLGVAMVVLVATNSAFQSRYNAIWLPLAMLVAARGLAQIRGPVAGRLAMAGVVLVALPGAARNAMTQRTQAREAAHAIRVAAPDGAVVAICPDQLGPSLSRELGDGFEVGTYPRFDPPEVVDWVDYVERTDAVSPESFADAVLGRAADKPLVLVWSGTYRTHLMRCEAVAHHLEAARGPARYVVRADPSVWESENVMVFPAAKGTP